MSIITDALRKAEDEKELKAKRVATIETPQPEVREEKVSPAQTLTESIFSQQVMQEQLADSVEFEEKSNWSRPFRILAVGFVVLSVCIWLVLPKKAAAPTITHTAQKAGLSYVLSGVSKLGDSRYAIINGAILQEGETIAGAQVKQILDNEVTLATRTGEIKLNIK